MLSDPRVKDPTTKLGKSFRKRFRIPFPLFVLICEQVNLHNMFEYVYKPYCTSPPTELKVLSCLRLLGRGNCFDDISEFSHIPMETLRYTFFKLVKNFFKILKPIFIKWHSLEEVVKIMGTYTFVI